MIKNANYLATDTGLSEKSRDEELLEHLAQDSQIAFEILYMRYKDKLRMFCLMLLKSDTVAQDVVQEIFITIWTGRKKLNSEQSFSSYLYTVAKNKSLNELRAVKRKESFENVLIRDNSSITDQDSADARLIIKEYQQLLELAINQLPEQKRKIYIMSRNQGLSHKEIASKLNLSPHTVQSHISDSLRSISDFFFRNADMEVYFIFVVFLNGHI